MITLLKTRNQRIKEKALAGDSEAQLKYAWLCYNGTRMERSIPAAQYWSFKALNKGLLKAADLFNLTKYPHYTGKEYFRPYKPWNISLRDGSVWYSDKFRLKFDKYKENSNWYRTYYVFRFVLLFIPKGAFRVLEKDGGWQVIGREQWHFFEYIWWILIDIAVIGGLVYLLIQG